MKLGNPPAAYDQTDQAKMRGAIERADEDNFKKRRDVILAANQRIVIPDEVTGTLYRLKVASGALSIVAYP